MAQPQVAINDRRDGPFIATAGQDVFPYTFPVELAGEITVTQVTKIGGAISTPAFATVIGAEGGTITLNTPAALDDEITIEGDRSLVRTSNYIPGGRFPAIDLNFDFNRITKSLQELRRDADNSAALRPETANGVSPILPAPLAGSAIGWNSAGLGLTNYATSEIFNIDIAGVSIYDHLEWNGAAWASISGATYAGDVQINADLAMTGDLEVSGDLLVDGGNIGITGSATLLTLASNLLTVAGDLVLNSSGGTTDIKMEGIEVIRQDGTTTYLGDVGGGGQQVIIRTNGGTALTIATGNDATFAGDLDVDGDLAVDGVAQIGSVTPTEGGINGQADDLVVSTNSHVGMTLATTGTTAVSNIYFAEGSSDKIAYISNHGSGHANAGQFKIATNITGGQIILYTNTQDIALTLDSSQNATFAGDLDVQGGTVINSIDSLVIGSEATNGHVWLQADGTGSIYLNRYGGSGGTKFGDGSAGNTVATMSSSGDLDMNGNLTVGTDTIINSVWTSKENHVFVSGDDARLIAQGGDSAGLVLIDATATLNQRVFAIRTDNQVTTLKADKDDGFTQKLFFTLYHDNGEIHMNLPVSDSGLATGALWADSGVVTVKS